MTLAERKNMKMAMEGKEPNGGKMETKKKKEAVVVDDDNLLLFSTAGRASKEIK